MNHKLPQKFFSAFILFSIVFQVMRSTPGSGDFIGIKSALHYPAGRLSSSKASLNNPPTSTHITLLFTGDINPGRCIALKSLAARDLTYPFQFVAEKLRSADITVGSLDGTLSDRSIPMPCPESMNLIGPSRMVEGMQLAGFDVITVATNHIKDCGEQGWNCNNQAFFDTLQTLQTAGIQPVGGGEDLTEARQPVILERFGIRFAFLAIDQIESRVWAAENQPGNAPLSTETIADIKEDITAAREQADIVIVLPQWGTEYNTRPNEYQRAWAKEFLNAGATLVVGNHPHIVQPVETFPEGVAFYALGNFIFDQPERSQRESIVVEAVFNGNQLESWRLLPVITNYYTLQSHWADGSEGEKILDRAGMLLP